MRSYCEWYYDTGRNVPCCLTATDIEMAAEPDRYQCAVCPRREREDGLLAVNREAWDLYQLLNSRAVAAFGLASWMMTRYAGEMTDTAALDLMQRVMLVAEVLTPPDEASTNGHPQTGH